MSAITLPGDRLPRFVFVRHGAAVDVEGRCVGHTDVALSPRGADAIRELANSSAPTWLSSAESPKGVRVVSSDLRRAFDSAAIIADVLGVSLGVDSRLREMSFGDWDGRPWSDIEHTDGNRLRAWTEHWASGDHPPNGESIDDLARRADGWIADALSSAHGTANIYIVVSHAGFIRVAISRLQFRPLARMFDIQIEHAQAIAALSLL